MTQQRRVPKRTYVVWLALTVASLALIAYGVVLVPGAGVAQDPSSAIITDTNGVDYPTGSQPTPPEVGEGLAPPQSIATAGGVEVLGPYLRGTTDSLLGVLVDSEGVRIIGGDYRNPEIRPLPSLPSRTDDRATSFRHLGLLGERLVLSYRADSTPGFDSPLIEAHIDAPTATVEAVTTIDSESPYLVDVNGSKLTVRQVEGEELVWNVNGSEIQDGYIQPLVDLPQGGFLVVLSGGEYSILDADGTLRDAPLPDDLPPAWSAAWGPGGLLALGLVTDQLAVVTPDGTVVEIPGATEGDIIDLFWPPGSSVVLTNVSAATVRGSGIVAYDLATGSCEKVFDWTPDLRLARRDGGM